MGSAAKPSNDPEPSARTRGTDGSAGAHGRSRLDALGVLAMLSYVLIGGVFVFGFGRALSSAVRTQNETPCRALQPEPLSLAAPTGTLEDLEGNPHTLAEYEGKLVVLNFWATYCEPCITEWPQLARLGERLAERDDVVVIAVSIDPEKADIEPFLSRMSLSDAPVTVLWDPSGTMHQSLGSTAIPDTYIIDERGTVTQMFENVRQWGSPDAVHCVEASAQG